MGWLLRRVSSACGAATQASHVAPRQGPLYSTAAQLRNTHKGCTHIQRQKPLSAMDWSRWSDASRTAPMLSTGRDGAQCVTRHFPTWRGGRDEDMSGIRIVRSLRRIAHSLAGSAVRRQRAARAVYCASGGVVVGYAVIICPCGCVGGCPVIRYSDTGGRSCEFARALSAAARSAQCITAERSVCGLALSNSIC